jgi:hypothetical protein
VMLTYLKAFRVSTVHARFSMKKGFGMLLVVVALSTAFSFANVIFSQQGRPIVGGYKEVAKDAEDVVAAANWAVEEAGRKQEAELSLVSIERAERQTVAGANYRLCLRVRVNGGDEDADDAVQDVKAVIYRNLKSQYELKSWDEESCDESK